jgi:hypothetical protein
MFLGISFFLLIAHLSFGAGTACAFISMFNLSRGGIKDGASVVPFYFFAIAALAKYFS